MFATNHIRDHLKRSTTHLFTLRQKVVNLAMGKKKGAVCEWWLGLIGEESSEFLEGKGYDHSVLPNDYTGEAPKDLKLVSANLDVVQVRFFLFFFFIFYIYIYIFFYCYSFFLFFFFQGLLGTDELKDFVSELTKKVFFSPIPSLLLPLTFFSFSYSLRFMLF